MILGSRLAAWLAASSVFCVITASLTVTGFAGAGSQKKENSNPQRPRQESTRDPRHQEPKEADEKPIRIGTDLVLLDVAVVDGANKPVMNLKQEQFQVLEDKVPQKIEFFSREQVPVSLVFTIDTSGSMRPKLDTVIAASSNLVKESEASDELAVVDFKDSGSIELLEEFTNNVNDVADSLQGLVAHGQTAMLDALYTAANYAAKEGKNRRKAIILFTDGDERNSVYGFNEVVQQLREIDVRVYLIGFTSDMESESKIFSKSPREKAEGLLNKLAVETGGKAFFPKELSEVHSIAEQISTDLRTQYSIGYYPSNPKRDGTFRSIKVEISGGGQRLVARTRSGYVSPIEAAPK
ncbi:MAG TPA: VWA domain-containing protein [Blastocatellia bacterium]|nr:VWA domain-containing protein [Blastocatellia bacterium]